MRTYETEDGVDKYIKMCDGYSNIMFRESILHHLQKGSSLLEIGMGPGNDFDWLKELYKITGSDYSDVFVKRALKRFPGSDIIQLDGFTLDTTKTFDAIYSSKVFQHCNLEELKGSLNRQIQLLNDRGLIIHMFWIGDTTYNYEDMHFIYHDRSKLEDLIESNFDILESKVYREFEEGDSLFIIARKRL